MPRRSAIGRRIEQAGLKRYQDKLAFARKLREHMTEPERLLWERLQYVAGWSCQVVLYGWIVDFYHSGKRIAVEIDGAIHTTPAQIKIDQIKDVSLWKRKIQVRRFVNKQVLDDVESVILQLRKY